MQQFKYTAVNIQKQKFNGIFIAEDEKDLAKQLAKQNLFLVSATPYSGKTPSAFFTLGTGKISSAEFTQFCRQFSIMLIAGISILESLECMKDQKYSNYFHNILLVIYDDVKSGVMLSDACDKHKVAFPEFFRSMIHVGEASGKLDMVFESIADYYEKDSAVKKKTKSAFAYPAVLLVMAVGIVILMVSYVVPTFKSVLAELEVEVSGFTKVVYAISDFFVAYWLYILAVVAVIGLAVFITLRTQKGKLFFDSLSMRLPLFGKIVISLNTARFARSFALLLSSGMTAIDALEAVKVVIGNREMKARFCKAVEDVRRGIKMSEAFNTYDVFPPVLIQMVVIGERTATLEDVLLRSCDYFDDQVDSALTSMTNKIQPILLCIMGALVGSMFIAVYSPMISIMEGLAN